MLQRNHDNPPLPPPPLRPARGRRKVAVLSSATKLPTVHREATEKQVQQLRPEPLRPPPHPSPTMQTRARHRFRPAGGATKAAGRPAQARLGCAAAAARLTVGVVGAGVAGEGGGVQREGVEVAGGALVAVLVSHLAGFRGLGGGDDQRRQDIIIGTTPPTPWVRVVPRPGGTCEYPAARRRAEGPGRCAAPSRTGRRSRGRPTPGRGGAGKREPWGGLGGRRKMVWQGQGARRGKMEAWGKPHPLCSDIQGKNPCLVTLHRLRAAARPPVPPPPPLATRPHPNHPPTHPPTRTRSSGVKSPRPRSVLTALPEVDMLAASDRLPATLPSANSREATNAGRASRVVVASRLASAQWS